MKTLDDSSGIHTTKFMVMMYAECPLALIESPLFSACRFGRMPVIKILLSRPDVDVNHRFYGREWTPLLEALHADQVEAALFILEHPLVDIHVRTRHGLTAMMFIHGSDDRVRLLTKMLRLIKALPVGQASIIQEQETAARIRAAAERPLIFMITTSTRDTDYSDLVDLAAKYNRMDYGRPSKTDDIPVGDTQNLLLAYMCQATKVFLQKRFNE